MDAPADAFPAPLLERFCGLFGPALIDRALPGQIDPALARQATLLNRLTARRQGEALSELLERGHRLLAMKGFATSHLYHREPESRITGDLDLLIEPSDLEAVVTSLRELGYRVLRDLPLPPWGFLSEASFLPMSSSDGLVDIDLHVQPDCYPLGKGLTARDVLAQAHVLRRESLSVPVPCAEHALLIALSNATKEKLGPQAAKSLLDVGRILLAEPNLDWDRVNTVLERTALAMPARRALTVVRALSGEPVDTTSFGPVTGHHMQVALANLGTGFADGFPFHRKLLNEVFLSAAPPVALRRFRDRLAGLVFKRSGVPPGAG